MSVERPSTARLFYLSLISGVEKMTVSLFWEKFENGNFRPKLTQIWPFLAWFADFSKMFSSIFGLPTKSVDLKDSRPSVCTSVRHAIARKQFITFFWNFAVMACKREKNVPSAFLKKFPVLPILAKNCPKLAILAQKWRFSHFSRNPFITFFWNFAVN